MSEIETLSVYKIISTQGIIIVYARGHIALGHTVPGQQATSMCADMAQFGLPVISQCVSMDCAVLN